MGFDLFINYKIEKHNAKRVKEKVQPYGPRIIISLTEWAVSTQTFTVNTKHGSIFIFFGGGEGGYIHSLIHIHSHSFIHIQSKVLSQYAKYGHLF